MWEDESFPGALSVLKEPSPLESVLRAASGFPQSDILEFYRRCEHDVSELLGGGDVVCPTEPRWQLFLAASGLGTFSVFTGQLPDAGVELVTDCLEVDTTQHARVEELLTESGEWFEQINSALARTLSRRTDKLTGEPGATAPKDLTYFVDLAALLKALCQEIS